MQRSLRPLLGHSPALSAFQRLTSSRLPTALLLSPLTARLLPPRPALASCFVFSSSIRSFAAITPTLPRLPVFEAIAKHDPASTAVVHSLSGRRFRYGELLADVRKARDQLIEAAGRTDDLNGERIGFMVENSYDYVGE